MQFVEGNRDKSYLQFYRYTFEVAPVFILMEDVVLKKMREVVGYKGGDGIFTPGREPISQ